MEQEKPRGLTKTVLNDLFSNVSSAALLAGSLVVFLAGAFVGLSLIPRLGGAGWFMYTLVMGTWALLFGPVIAYAAGLRDKGSARHRRELAARREQQRRHFGLHLRGDDSHARQSGETAAERMNDVAVARPRTPSPSSATQGPTETDT